VSTRAGDRLPLWTLPIRGVVAIAVYLAVPFYALPLLRSAGAGWVRSGVRQLSGTTRWAGQKTLVVGPRWIRRRREAVARWVALLDKRRRRAAHRVRSTVRRR
jgi:hypothetical protein